MSQIRQFKEDFPDLSWSSIEELTGLIRNTLNKWDKAENRQVALENLLDGTRLKIRKLKHAERKLYGRKKVGRKVGFRMPKISETTDNQTQSEHEVIPQENNEVVVKQEAPTPEVITPVINEGEATQAAEDVARVIETLETQESNTPVENGIGSAITETREIDKVEQEHEAKPTHVVNENEPSGSIASAQIVKETKPEVELVKEIKPEIKAVEIEQSSPLDDAEKSIYDKNKLIQPLKSLTRNRQAPTYSLILGHVNAIKTMLADLNQFGPAGEERKSEILEGRVGDSIRWFENL